MKKQPNAFEKIFLEYLNNFNPEHLKFAVKQKVSLADLLVQFLSPIAIKSFRLAGSLYRNKSNIINIESMLNYLELTRPDLAQVFRGSIEARRWLGKQIKDVKKIFGLR